MIWWVVIAFAFFRVGSHAWFREVTHLDSTQSVSAVAIVAASAVTAPAMWRAGRLGRAAASWPVVLSLVYLGTLLLAVPAAWDTGLALEGAAIAVAQVLLLLIAFALSANEHALRTTLLFLVAYGLLTAAATALMFADSLGGTPTLCGNALCMGPHGFRPIFVLGHWYPQASIPGIDKNTVGLQLAVVTLTTLYFARTATRRRWAWHCATLVLFLGMTVTFSKGALASFAFGVIVLMIRRWYRPVQLVMMAGVAAVVLAWSGLLGALLIRILTVFQFLPWVSDLLAAQASKDTSDRLASVPSTLAFFSQSPFIGIGPLNLNRFQVAVFGASEHNFYLRTLAETGVIGEAGLLILLVGLIVVSLRALIRSAGSPLGDVLVAGLVVYLANLVAASVDYSFWLWAGLLLCWAMPRLHADRQQRAVRNVIAEIGWATAAEPDC